MSDRQPVRPGGPSVLGTILILLVSIVSLLPGLCSLIFTTTVFSNLGAQGLGSGALFLWLGGLVISVTGIRGIVRALRR
jgi:hypothetical protein